MKQPWEVAKVDERRIELLIWNGVEWKSFVPVEYAERKRDLINAACKRVWEEAYEKGRATGRRQAMTKEVVITKDARHGP